MLKNKVYFFFLLFFAFYIEDFASEEAKQELQGKEKKEEGSKKKDKDSFGNFNHAAHIFFYFLLSPFLNVNNPDWRYYFFRGQLNKGGIFFYYGFFNFGIGFNGKIFCDTRSCRILGVNLFQFLGSLVLFFFVDSRQSISDRWRKNQKDRFSFFLFNDEYIEKYVHCCINSKNMIKDSMKKDFFTRFVLYSFALFPFLSFFTFDFQLFEYLTFSLNIGSFLFLTLTFFVYTFWKHIEKPSGCVLEEIKSYREAFDNSKDMKQIEMIEIAS